MFENMSISELRRALDTGKTTSVEITKYYLEKINKDKTNSFITVFEDEALKDAKNADKLILQGHVKALTGIPVALKDNICTKGQKTTCASKMLCDFKPPYDATVVTKLREQGAVIIGKTNMDEFGMGSHSRNSYFGQVRNPINATRSPGGSSGGSAAAVAAGLVPCALGSDTGGSVRQPASYCGITGMKPTYGRVSRYGLIAYASSLDQVGVFTKSVKDAALVLEAIAGQDKADLTSADEVFENKKTSLEGKVIGLVREFFDCADKEVAESVTNAALYYKKQGATLKEVSLPSLKYALPAYYIIAAAESASNLARYDGVRFGHRSKRGDTYEEQVSFTRSEGFGGEVKKRILLGNFVLSEGYYDEYYKKALAVRAQITEEYEELFKVCDILITPTAPTVAPKLDEKNGYADDVCTVPVSLAGLPSISIPCGYNKEGLPIGMSLTARHFDEALLLTAADIFERGRCLDELHSYYRS